MLAVRRRGGPPDPERRARIAQAAIVVISEHGVAGLTHRRVAVAADVPLGSTTYYFKTLDELLQAALEIAVAESTDDLRRWSAELDGNRLQDGLVDLLMRRLGAQRHRTLVHYELYVACFRRPDLARISTQWATEFARLLYPYFDPIAAEALAATLDGLLLEGLIRDKPPSRRHLAALVQESLRQLRPSG